MASLLWWRGKSISALVSSFFAFRARAIFAVKNFGFMRKELVPARLCERFRRVWIVSCGFVISASRGIAFVASESALCDFLRIRDDSADFAFRVFRNDSSGGENSPQRRSRDRMFFQRRVAKRLLDFERFAVASVWI